MEEKKVEKSADEIRLEVIKERWAKREDNIGAFTWGMFKRDDMEWLFQKVAALAEKERQRTDTTQEVISLAKRLAEKEAALKEAKAEIRHLEQLREKEEEERDSLRTQLTAKEAALKKVGRCLVCAFCGEGFGYAGQKPDDATMKSAIDHEANCPKNPYKAKIADLQAAHREEVKRLEGDAAIVSVGGVYMDRSIADFRRACENLIAEEERKPNPDNALIGVLCDSIRLTRELVKVATADTRAEAAEALTKEQAGEIEALTAELEGAREAYETYRNIIKAQDRDGQLSEAGEDAQWWVDKQFTKIVGPVIRELFGQPRKEGEE